MTVSPTDRSPAIPRPDPLRLRTGSPAREGWTLDPGTIHINHGSYGAVPRAAQQRQVALREEMESDPLSWFLDLPPRVAEARGHVSRFIGSDAAHTALVPNTSAGVSAVLSSIALAEGAEIVVTDHGYGSVVAGARRHLERAGGRLITARVPLGATAEEAHEAVLSACSDRTTLLIVDQITSPTARYLPVADIVQGARERGIRTLVDAAHAPGIQAQPYVPADYWVGNLHKWGCAPRGVAALVARPEVSDDLHPLIDSWGAGAPFPERFDIQATTDWTAALAAESSFGFIEEQWGWDRARAYMSDLADYGQDIVADAFSSRTGEDHTVDVGAPVESIRLVRLPGIDSLENGVGPRLQRELLADHGFAVQLPSFDGIGYWRLSAHVYNTPEDFEEFAERAVPVIIDRLEQAGR